MVKSTKYLASSAGGRVHVMHPRAAGEREWRALAETLLPLSPTVGENGLVGRGNGALRGHVQMTSVRRGEGGLANS